MRPPHDDFCSQSDRARVVAKSASKEVAKRERGVGDKVSPVEALRDWYRIKFAELLLQLLRDRRLDRKDKLDILRAVFKNVPPVLVELCDRASDKALARSGVAFFLAEVTGQLGVTLADVMRLERAVTARANSVRARRASHASLRARGR
jgi:hypothetical protein